MATLTIGQLARSAGVGVETVRFYEREGLLTEPPRKGSGYRPYPDHVALRLRFIRHAKDLGFSLREIKELLALRFGPTTTCAEVRQRTEAKIADIESRIATLRRMKIALRAIAEGCPGEGAIEDCPILAALERDELAVDGGHAGPDSKASGKARGHGTCGRAGAQPRR
jgi:MerR family mercuric resistance operon transcriptional regulator